MWRGDRYGASMVFWSPWFNLIIWLTFSLLLLFLITISTSLFNVHVYQIKQPQLKNCLSSAAIVTYSNLFFLHCICFSIINVATGISVFTSSSVEKSATLKQKCNYFFEIIVSANISVSQSNRVFQRTLTIGNRDGVCNRGNSLKNRSQFIHF